MARSSSPAAVLMVLSGVASSCAAPAPSANSAASRSLFAAAARVRGQLLLARRQRLGHAAHEVGDETGGGGKGHPHA